MRELQAIYIYIYIYIYSTLGKGMNPSIRSPDMDKL